MNAFFLQYESVNHQIVSLYLYVDMAQTVQTLDSYAYMVISQSGKMYLLVHDISIVEDDTIVVPPPQGAEHFHQHIDRGIRILYELLDYFHQSKAGE